MSRPDPRKAAQTAALSRAMAGAVDLAAESPVRGRCRSCEAPATGGPGPAAAPAGAVGHRRQRGDVPGRGARALAAGPGRRRPVGRVVRPVQAALAGAGTSGRRRPGSLDPGQGRRRREPADRAGVRVQSIPMVVAVVGGQPVQLFNGALPEPQVRQTIDSMIEQLRDRMPGIVAAEKAAAAPAVRARSRSRTTPVHRRGGRSGARRLRRRRGGLRGDPRRRAGQRAGGDGVVAGPLPGPGRERRPVGDPGADAAPDDVDAQLAAADRRGGRGPGRRRSPRLVATVQRTFGDDRDRVREHLVGLFELFPADDPRVPARLARRPGRARWPAGAPWIRSACRLGCDPGPSRRGGAAATFAGGECIPWTVVSAVHPPARRSRLPAASRRRPARVASHRRRRAARASRPGWLALLPSPDMHELHPDFDTFRASAVALVQGGDIYDTPAKLRNLNPPLLAVLLTPFALLDALPAYRLFTVLTLLLVVGAVLVVARELRLTAGVTTVVVLVVLARRPCTARCCWADLRAPAGRAWWPGGSPSVGATRCSRRRATGSRWRSSRRWPRCCCSRSRCAGGGRACGFRRPPWRRCSGCWSRARPQAWVAADRSHRAGARHRRQRLAARPGRAVRTTGRGRDAAGARGARRHAGRAGPVAPPGRPAGTAPWAVLAAGLLMSPIAWHNYLMLLWPGVLLLLGRGGRWRSGTATRPGRAAVLLAVAVIRCRGTRCGRRGVWRSGRMAYCAVLLAYWWVLLVVAPEPWSGAPVGRAGGRGVAAPPTATEFVPEPDRLETRPGELHRGGSSRRPRPAAPDRFCPQRRVDLGTSGATTGRPR